MSKYVVMTVSALILATFAAVCVSESILADTVDNARYSSAGPNKKKLTLTGADTGSPPTSSNFSIPVSATITVYDAECQEIHPQPEFTVSPSKGALVSSQTITLESGTFADGGKVIISTIETAGTLPKPSGVFGL